MEMILFKKVFIEKNIENAETTKNIVSRLPQKSRDNIVYIDSYQDIFGKVKKPYLQKRDNLNLFIAEKKGLLVKEAPEAYGLNGEKHFYFINSYNCIYECEYCYLQGFFNSPDIVVFTNWDEIKKEIQSVAKKYPGSWFHAGEFSDSLALSHLTGELGHYFKLFKNLPEAKLELRTKSINIREALEIEPLNNVIFSFSVSTEDACKNIDLKTPPLKHRLKAIKELQDKGHQVGLHLDPIIWSPSWSEEHNFLVEKLSSEILLNKVSYISIGVVRFTEPVYHQFQKNYPHSKIHQGELTKSFDQKIRYPRALRNKMLSFLRETLVCKGVKNELIYDCME